MKTNKALISILCKYIDFIDNFFKNLVAKLLEHSRINNHIINLIKGIQSSYRPIYSLKSIKLEILKAYIKSNLANSFIKLSKLPISTFILFNKKLDSSL